MTAVLALDVVVLACGIAVLYFGADWLVRGAAHLAGSIGVSPIVVGLTVVSFGTSAPELVVSSVASLRGSGGLAMGNVLGSNLANLGLILGLTAMVRPLAVHARVVVREVPLMLLAMIALYPLALSGRTISRVEGVALLAGLAAYLFFMFRWVEDETPETLGEYEDFVKASGSHRSGASVGDVMLVVVGCTFLVLGGWLIVEGAIDVAVALGLSDTIVGLTVVAVGTSLPELATSLIATLRGEADIAVGNVIGSNIFNTTGILGVASVIAPIPVGPSTIARELPAVLILSVVVLPMLRTDWEIGRLEGALLLGGYVALGLWLV